MKVTLTHDGKSVELDLTAEQMSALGLKEEKKRTGYERVGLNHEYCFVNDYGFVLEDEESIDLSRMASDLRYNDCNYYSDWKLAGDNARADRLMRQLRRFAAENGGIPSKKDWERSGAEKWRIEYSHTLERLSVVFNASTQGFGFVYFNDPNKAHEAMEYFRDELIWYFTEYEAMLR